MRQDHKTLFTSTLTLVFQPLWNMLKIQHRTKSTYFWVTIIANLRFITIKICMRSLPFGTFQIQSLLMFFKLMRIILFFWLNIKINTILNILTNCMFLMSRILIYLISKALYFLLTKLKLLTAQNIIHVQLFTVRKNDNSSFWNFSIKKFKLLHLHMMKISNSPF